MLPVVAALAANFTRAWIALFIGALQLIHAYQMRKESGVVWRVLSGLLNVALGVVLFWWPLEGVIALALILAALVTAIGIIEIVFAVQHRSAPRWGWVLATGIVSVLLGILIAAGWPENSFLFMGFYVAISMICGGVWRIALGLALRKAADAAPSDTAPSNNPSSTQAASAPHPG
jgi:uncharacterized membrane protein HdeD (DUF308 family)